MKADYEDEDGQVTEIELMCGSCGYFVKTNVYKHIHGEKKRVGFCHRAPPNQSGEMSKTIESNWCGEFVVKKTEVTTIDVHQ